MSLKHPSDGYTSAEPKLIVVLVQQAAETRSTTIQDPSSSPSAYREAVKIVAENPSGHEQQQESEATHCDDVACGMAVGFVMMRG